MSRSFFSLICMLWISICVQRRLLVSSEQGCSTDCAGNSYEPFDNIWSALIYSSTLTAEPNEILLLKSNITDHYLLTMELDGTGNPRFSLPTVVTLTNEIIIRPLFCDEPEANIHEDLGANCLERGSEDKLKIFIKTENAQISVLRNFTVERIEFDGVEDIEKFNNDLTASLEACLYSRIRCCSPGDIFSFRDSSIICYDKNGKNTTNHTSLFFVGNASANLSASFTLINSSIKNINQRASYHFIEYDQSPNNGYENNFYAANLQLSNISLLRYYEYDDFEEILTSIDAFLIKICSASLIINELSLSGIFSTSVGPAMEIQNIGGLLVLNQTVSELVNIIISDSFFNVTPFLATDDNISFTNFQIKNNEIALYDNGFLACWNTYTMLFNITFEKNTILAYENERRILALEIFSLHTSNLTFLGSSFSDLSMTIENTFFINLPSTGQESYLHMADVRFRNMTFDIREFIFVQLASEYVSVTNITFDTIITLDSTTIIFGGFSTRVTLKKSSIVNCTGEITVIAYDLAVDELLFRANHISPRISRGAINGQSLIVTNSLFIENEFETKTTPFYSKNLDISHTRFVNNTFHSNLFYDHEGKALTLSNTLFEGNYFQDFEYDIIPLTDPCTNSTLNPCFLSEITFQRNTIHFLHDGLSIYRINQNSPDIEAKALIFKENLFIKEENNTNSYFAISSLNSGSLNYIAIYDSLSQERVVLFSITSSNLTLANVFLQNSTFSARDLALISCIELSVCYIKNLQLNHISLEDAHLISSEDSSLQLHNLTITNSTSYSTQFVVSKRSSYIEINGVNITQNIIRKSTSNNPVVELISILSTTSFKLYNLNSQANEFEDPTLKFLSIESSIAEIRNCHFEDNNMFMDGLFQAISLQSYLMENITMLNNNILTHDSDQDSQFKIISLDKSQASIKAMNSNRNHYQRVTIMFFLWIKMKSICQIFLYQEKTLRMVEIFWKLLKVPSKSQISL